jgi:hypothetical protein
MRLMLRHRHLIPLLVAILVIQGLVAVLPHHHEGEPEPPKEEHEEEETGVYADLEQRRVDLHGQSTTPSVVFRPSSCRRVCVTTTTVRSSSSPHRYRVGTSR